MSAENSSRECRANTSIIGTQRAVPGTRSWTDLCSAVPTAQGCDSRVGGRRHRQCRCTDSTHASSTLRTPRSPNTRLVLHYVTMEHWIEHVFSPLLPAGVIFEGLSTWFLWAGCSGHCAPALCRRLISRSGESVWELRKKP